MELLGLMSRRSLLRSGALAGGLAVAGGMFGEAAARASGGSVTPAGKIFQITQTAEQLAVTLYSRGVANGLGLEDDDLDYMAQIACNEAEHRVLARQIAAEAGFERLPNINPGGSGTVPTGPPDNWAYTPVFFHTTPQVVDLVKADGSMIPRPGNSFEYQPIDFHDNVYGDVFERITFRTPFAK